VVCRYGTCVIGTGIDRWRIYQTKDILQPIEKTIFSSVLHPCADGLRIAFSERSADDCVLGAIAIVLDDILHEMVIT
jgi:hypothetical protein